VRGSLFKKRKVKKENIKAGVNTIYELSDESKSESEEEEQPDSSYSEN
jgi:hypothetical protein